MHGYVDGTSVKKIDKLPDQLKVEEGMVNQLNKKSDRQEV